MFFFSAYTLDTSPYLASAVVACDVTRVRYNYVMREARGDMWALPADVRAVTTNGIVKSNGAAVMGRGVALQAQAHFHGCDLVLGQLLQEGGNHVHVLCEDLVSFPVKHHWRDPADPELIRRSAHELVALTDAHGWQRVVVPRPGCGAGQLHWSEVRAIIAPIFDDRFVVVDL